MSNWKLMALFSAGALAALLVGCASREVEVAGHLHARGTVNPLHAATVVGFVRNRLTRATGLGTPGA